MDLWLKINLIITTVTVIMFGFDLSESGRLAKWLLPPRVYLLNVVAITWLVFILVTVW